MRTTVDIDDPILKEVRALGKKRGQSLGRLISDLLAQSLRARKTPPVKPSAWIAKPMRARVDLEDKEAVYGAMEKTGPRDGGRRP